ncbi:MAG: hypothetical protein EOO61_22615 [Hymenobacter sp.]|nr:MAG: hypothetical protein EOO61_22615 [Hymenobacter sp.]
MPIQLAEWLRTGLLSPLHWGATARDLVEALPAAQAEIDQLRTGGYPFIVLDGIEFYFTTDTFEDLCEICMKVWTLAEDATSAYFDYGWLRKGLTNSQVQIALQAQGIAYQVERGPAFKTPNLRTATGVLFSFYTDFDTETDAELMNAYLSTRIGLNV